MLKKILLGLLIAIGLLLIAGYAYIQTAPVPAEESQAALLNIMEEGHHPIEAGVTGYTDNEGIKIWYEYIQPTTEKKGDVLLVMGHSTSGINWSDYFYQPLLDSGYAVVIYDNRGVGKSDWMKDWSSSDPYTLEDMGMDGIAILDELKIEKAHVVGVSMGGMIAQSLAINHPDRVKTLGCLMTSGYMYDPDIKPVDPSFERNMLKLAAKYFIIPTDEEFIKYAFIVSQELKGEGDYKLDYERTANRTMYELKDRAGINLRVGLQHTAAIQASGSRYDALKKLDLPTVVIHGTTDPLVWPEHSKKFQPMIPNSKMVWIEGMGHDIPQAYTPQVIEALVGNFHSAVQDVQ